MSAQNWISCEQQQYKFEYFLGESQLNRICENISKCGVDQVEVQAFFSTNSDLHKFQEIHQQQILEQGQFSYIFQSQPIQQINRFYHCKDINAETQFDVKQLTFPSYQFLGIFMRIYQLRLIQMQIEYNYKLRIKRNFLKVYFPRNQKISGFFTNEILQMKMRLNFFYSYNPVVIQKVRLSQNFNKFLNQEQITAQHHYYFHFDNYEGVAIFYSIVHSRQQIIQIVNKSSLKHMNKIQLFDIKLSRKANQIIFHLISSFLNQIKKKLEKHNQIIIQQNKEKCYLLIHDYHQCFKDASNQIQSAISDMIFFKLDGPSTRTHYNKIITSHGKYPFLRVKYSKRSLYCVLNYQIFGRCLDHQQSFRQLFQEYFQDLEQTTVTFYLKNLRYPNFISFVQQLIQYKNIAIKNYEHLMSDIQCPELILRAMDYSTFTIQKTKKQYFQAFQSIIFKKTVERAELNPKPRQNIGIIDISENNSKQLTYSQASQSQKIESQIGQPMKILIGTSKPALPQGNPRGLEQLKEECFHKYGQSKHIQLRYLFKTPTVDQELNNFWDCQKRQEKLERILNQKYPETFRKYRFKAFNMVLKNKYETPKLEQLESDKIYMSTTVQKDDKIHPNFIDLNEFIKIQKQRQDQYLFIFYKVKDRQKYIPSYALKLA